MLLGASFGGMLAYLYANTYPDEVVGMVLLDSMFPDELTWSPWSSPRSAMPPTTPRTRTSRWNGSATTRCSRPRQRYIGKEPAIPVTYLASIPEGFDNGRPRGGVQQQDRSGVQEAYVDRFRPGTLIRVDAPHFMEPDDSRPDRRRSCGT